MDEETQTIIGTSGFMAPELVRGECSPSVETDLFAFSVLIFQILLLSHPLEGLQESSIAVLDEAAILRLHGTHPLFIFDPHDDSNRPDRERHQIAWTYWALLPRFFERAPYSSLHFWAP